MRIFLATLIALLTISTTSFAGFEEGRKAYQSEDWMTAIKELRPLAEAGNADANLLIANMYIDGKGVIQNYKTAFKLYKKATDLGSIDAMLAAGTLYLKGTGTEKNYEEGIKLYNSCANKNHYMCTFLMGMTSLYGDNNSKKLLDIEKDIAEEKVTSDNLIKAYKWFSISGKNTANDRIAHTSGKLAELIAEERLNEQELEAANSLISEWEASQPKPETKD